MASITLTNDVNFNVNAAVVDGNQPIALNNNATIKHFQDVFLNAISSKWVNQSTDPWAVWAGCTESGTRAESGGLQTYSVSAGKVHKSSKSSLGVAGDFDIEVEYSGTWTGSVVKCPIFMVQQDSNNYAGIYMAGGTSQTTIYWNHKLAGSRSYGSASVSGITALRLTRSGNNFEWFYKTTGAWVSYKTATVALPSALDYVIGLWVYTGTGSGVANFDNFKVNSGTCDRWDTSPEVVLEEDKTTKNYVLYDAANVLEPTAFSDGNTLPGTTSINYKWQIDAGGWSAWRTEAEMNTDAAAGLMDLAIGEYLYIKAQLNTSTTDTPTLDAVVLTYTIVSGTKVINREGSHRIFGLYALEIDIAGYGAGQEKGIYQDQILIANADYRLICWYDFDAKTVGTFYIEAYDVNASTVLASTTISATTSDYEKVTLNFSTGANTNVRLRAKLQNETTGNVFINYLDAHRVI